MKNHMKHSLFHITLGLKWLSNPTDNRPMENFIDSTTELNAYPQWSVLLFFGLLPNRVAVRRSTVLGFLISFKSNSYKKCQVRWHVPCYRTGISPYRSKILWAVLSCYVSRTVGEMAPPSKHVQFSKNNIPSNHGNIDEESTWNSTNCNWVFLLLSLI
jgi:hypothetical protein